MYLPLCCLQRRGPTVHSHERAQRSRPPRGATQRFFLSYALVLLRDQKAEWQDTGDIVCIGKYPPPPPHHFCTNLNTFTDLKTQFNLQRKILPVWLALYLLHRVESSPCSLSSVRVSLCFFPWWNQHVVKTQMKFLQMSLVPVRGAEARETFCLCTSFGMDGNEEQMLRKMSGGGWEPSGCIFPGGSRRSSSATASTAGSQRRVRRKKKIQTSTSRKESCAFEYSLMQLKPWLRLSMLVLLLPHF